MTYGAPKFTTNLKKITAGIGEIYQFGFSLDYSRASLLSAVIRGQGKSTIQGAFVMTIVGFLGQARGMPVLLNLHPQEKQFCKGAASFTNVFVNQTSMENLYFHSSPFYNILEMSQIQTRMAPHFEISLFLKKIRNTMSINASWCLCICPTPSHWEVVEYSFVSFDQHLHRMAETILLLAAM